MSQANTLTSNKTQNEQKGTTKLRKRSELDDDWERETIEKVPGGIIAVRPWNRRNVTHRVKKCDNQREGKLGTWVVNKIRSCLEELRGIVHGVTLTESEAETRQTREEKGKKQTYVRGNRCSTCNTDIKLSHKFCFFILRNWL